MFGNKSRKISVHLQGFLVVFSQAQQKHYQNRIHSTFITDNLPSISFPSLLRLLPSNPPHAQSISIALSLYIYVQIDRFLLFLETFLGFVKSMGFLKAKGEVYKPVCEVDLGPDSDEVYLRANVKGMIRHNSDHCFFLFNF